MANTTLGQTLANVLDVVNNGVGIAVVIGCATMARTGSVVIVLGLATVNGQRLLLS